MRVLFVTSEPQYVGAGGGVTYTRSIHAMLEGMDGVRVTMLVIRLPWSGMPAAARRWRALLLSLPSALPTKAHHTLDAANRRRLREALAQETPDLVILNHGDIMSLVDEVPPDLPVVLISHNVETDIIRGKFAQMTIPPIARRILDRDVEKTRRMEEAGARRARFIVAISGKDAAWYRALSPEIDVEVITGGFTYPGYAGPRPPARRPLQLGYLAKLNWWPNRQGADWFLSSVLPALPAGAVEAHYFGLGSEAYRARHPMLCGHGFVDRLEDVWSRVNFTICPIHGGSGVNIKLIESLHNGVPVLATPDAVRGLPALSDPALAVVPPDQWVAFLGSERALALASAKVRPQTRALFALDTGVEKLRGLLNRTQPGQYRLASWSDGRRLAGRP